MTGNKDCLALFHPLIAHWFKKSFVRATDIQERAWPGIAAGDHLLITAPTGSGKTLAAFLWALNQLASGQWETGFCRVLYVSPLKALNNDIQRNLLTPLREIGEVFKEHGALLPEIRVLTRSGDTPATDRRNMQRHPPEILITTPESLNILLTSRGGQTLLTGLKAVILDEIHGVYGSKRGVHLITAVERLVLLSGEFQRIALSATIRPMDQVARFVGGYTVAGAGPGASYRARPVMMVESDLGKDYDIKVRFMGPAVEQDSRGSVWASITSELKTIIGRNRSTLIFVNSRRLCEKLTMGLNSGEDRPVAYAHHGSLSREIREEVERKLKIGELRAIVATSSLEMGLDIGALDEVVLIQTPPAVSAAVQRVGRAGHQVGQVSRGTLFPTHHQDLLESAALAQAVVGRDIEEIAPIESPLDVLAQVLVSMTAQAAWDIDVLFAQLKACFPYRHLSRPVFDLVLNMLGGRYADSRIRELKPRLSIDRLDHTVRARPGAALLLYTAGGVIPDRGYYQLRHQETNSRIGELDEEFVWEARIGQIFTLGTQNWKIARITHSDVFVVPAGSRAPAAPFWKSEETGRDFHFSEKIGLFLEAVNDRLDLPDLPVELGRDYHLDGQAAEELITYLQKQKEVTGLDLPHRHHLVVEHTSTGPGGVPGNQVVLHTYWGGRVNRPLALALEAAWERSYNQRPEIFVENDAVAIVLPQDVAGERLLSLVTSGEVEHWLRNKLEGSGFFGARFRECAGRALLVTRQKIRVRMPLWMSRLRAKKLLDAVRPYRDFPILLETWRTCLQDEFDLESLKTLLSELETGQIRWSETHTAFPSPMARTMSWRQTNQYMYQTDEPLPSGPSALRGELIREVVFTPGLRPTVARETVRRFTEKRQRLSPGYTPGSARDLVDWVKERLLIPRSEWERLVSGLERDHGPTAVAWVDQAMDRLAWFMPAKAAEPLVAALELLPGLKAALYEPEPGVEDPNNGEETAVGPVGEWLRFYGPVDQDFVRRTLGLDPARLIMVLDELLEGRQIISGRLVTDGGDDEICDGENFEALLRQSRREARPDFETRPLEDLPLFMADFHGLIDRAGDQTGLAKRLEQLQGYQAAAGLWETEILPARFSVYHPAWLDALMQEGDMLWLGGPNRQVSFVYQADLDLMVEDTPRVDQEVQVSKEEASPGGSGPVRGGGEADGLFRDPRGKYAFTTLLQATGMRPQELSDLLWDAVWQGRVTNDSFMVLRRGLENGFKLPSPAVGRPGNKRGLPGRRSGLAKWAGALPTAGNWQRLEYPEPGLDLLEAEERLKDRARLLFDRYGLIFRELLQRERPGFRWADLFRTLRLMELSGEILSGLFFHGLPGLQFISHEAFRRLQRSIDTTRVYWLNAADPASACGLGLAGFRVVLPPRVEATHLAYRGREPAMISKGHGRDLEFLMAADDPDLPACLGPLSHLLTRAVSPLNRIVVETINGEEASASPYVGALKTVFETMVEFRKVILYKGRV
jgi:ATP-dependent Lhr-like helicase